MKPLQSAAFEEGGGVFRSRPGAPLAANSALTGSGIGGGKTSDSAWGQFFGGNSPIGAAMGATPATAAIGAAGKRIVSQLPMLAGTYVEPPSALTQKPVMPTLRPEIAPDAPAMASFFQNPGGFASQNAWDSPQPPVAAPVPTGSSFAFAPPSFDATSTGMNYMDKLRRFGTTQRW